ncbi:hypothetical protein EV421DRAFT_1467090 [Armillaria borealis]|uniref:Uncharacterized protein n=1 Tax=Armillaria borealis TaxID=47425 RepID=A0AA39JTD1_9AGAR|nr:hypothetical protein EV421DRAFT_1467090 [Armillaria borealis]
MKLLVLFKRRLFLSNFTALLLPRQNETSESMQLSICDSASIFIQSSWRAPGTNPHHCEAPLSPVRAGLSVRSNCSSGHDFACLSSTSVKSRKLNWHIFMSG